MLALSDAKEKLAEEQEKSGIVQVIPAQEGQGETTDVG